MPTRNQQFAAKVRELMQQSRLLAPAARRNVLELLEAARKRVVADLAGISPSSFQAAQLQQLKRSIDAAFDQFAREAAGAVSRFQSRSFELGLSQMSEPMAAAGFPAPAFVGVDRTTLSIAQGYTADLVTALSKDAAAKVNAAIQRAFLGGQSVTEIIEQIGRGLSGMQGFSGLFSPIGERATTIAVNEILRVHSIAGQARLEEVRSRLPEVKKQWRWIPAARVPRILHQQASGQIREVDEPFEVAGEELMYPRDPAGSPENTINCHCMLLPFVAPEDLKPTAGQQQTLRDLGISVEVTRESAREISRPAA